MIQWKMVTEAEPTPGYSGYVLLLADCSDQEDLKIGWRDSTGSFHSNFGVPSPRWWAPINLPSENPDEEEGRVAALERRVAALEAAASVASEAEPQRVTGWAVLDEAGRALTDVLFSGGHRRLVSWLGSREDAKALARLLGTGRAALLYKDTLEEVAAKQ